MCSTTPVMVKNRASGSAKRTSMTVTAASTGSARLPWVTQVTPAAMTSSKSEPRFNTSILASTRPFGVL